MIYCHYFKNILKIEIYILLVYVNILLKMDYSHLFQKVLIFLFHAWEVMDNEIYKLHNMTFIFICVCVCVLLLLGFLEWI
jgi:hypothetical protein